jgi:3-dehydroquinate dehydratase-1
MKGWRRITHRGKPEVCLSLNCTSMEELKNEIAMYGEHCNMVEWCLDEISGVENWTREQLIEQLAELKQLLGNKRLVINYKGEEIDTNRILRWAIGVADMLDVDAANSEAPHLAKEAKKKGTKTIISHHVFDHMPHRDEIATQFLRMEKIGGDILKIACMANKESDTYAVLEAASAYTALKYHKPIIAIAMGEEGQASRICAGDFGSVISYSCGSRPTAPGQFNARDLSRYLNIYYEGSH